MNDHVWVTKEYTKTVGGLNHYGVAKFIVAELEKLKEKDHNVEFTLNPGQTGSLMSVTFRWKEREEF